MKKKIFVFFSFIFSLNAFAKNFSSQQLIQSGHWVYDALSVLNSEQKLTSFAVNAPMTCAELKLYFSYIDYNLLSDGSKKIYDKVSDFLKIEKPFFSFKGGFASVNLESNPTFFYKSNPDLDWSFLTDYTGKIQGSPKSFNKENFYAVTKDYSGEEGVILDFAKTYAPSSNYFQVGTKPFISADVNLGWGEVIHLNAVPSFSKNFWGMNDPYNFVNMPYEPDQIEFFQPFLAYASLGYVFDSWGFNVNCSRQGFQVGKTLTGSVIYNSTFQTDFFLQFNLYNRYLKYNMDVVQVSKNRYMYLHSLDIIPYFKWLKVGILEGTFVNDSFEMRFLNPLMFMHSHGAWSDNLTKQESHWLSEANICQYMGIQAEIVPCKNMRLYALYAQNELQSEAEKSSLHGKCLPDSFGIQLGIEYSKTDKSGGYWFSALEGIYTSPFLYIKQGSLWSLYSSRFDMQKNGSVPICSWIGSPFGPDAIGAKAVLRYERPCKWNLEAGYLFVAHGTNSFGLFSSKVLIDGVEYSAYYPSVLRSMGLISDKEAIDMARTLNLTGIIQYTNQIELNGKYFLNEHVSFNSKIVYSFVFNNKNQEGVFAHGIELSVGSELKLFK